jgi:hypothetical protein
MAHKLAKAKKEKEKEKRRKKRKKKKRKKKRIISNKRMITIFAHQATSGLDTSVCIYRMQFPTYHHITHPITVN